MGLLATISIAFLVQLLAANSPFSQARSSTELKCSETTNSYLWKVRTTPPIYLFGTMHVPYNLLWNDIPENAKVALQESNRVFLELKLTDSETRQALQKCSYLPQNVTVHDVLTRNTSQRIQNYFNTIKNIFPKWTAGDNGVTLAHLHQSSVQFSAITRDWYLKRPIWLLFMLSSFTKEAIEQRYKPILDQFLETGSEGVGKRVEAIETVHDQCRPLNRLNNSDVEVALKNLLDVLEPQTKSADGPSSSVDSDVAIYQCGDFVELAETQLLLPVPNNTNLSSEDLMALQRMNKFLDKQLIERRNRKITNKVVSWLGQQRNSSYYIAIGAGHLIGHKSIVHMLRKKGYTVDHIAVNETINGSSLTRSFEVQGDPSLAPSVLEITSPQIATPPNHLPTLGHLSNEQIDKIFQRVFNSSSSKRRSARMAALKRRLTVHSLSSRGITVSTNVLVSHSVPSTVENRSIPNSTARLLHNHHIIMLCLLIAIFSLLFR